MKAHYFTDSVPEFRKAVITIGTFDGVHLGHRQIIEVLKMEAARIGGESVIITFHPHPRMVVAGTQQPVQLINTIEEKIVLLDQCGIDHLVIVPFTTAFSQQTPEAYIEYFLVNKFNPHTVIIGYDHRFGQGRKGDYHLLETYSEKLGFILKEIPPHVIQENTVSSTRIREAVLKGDINLANTLLGYDFFFEGMVVEGNKLGRQLGFPTANLQIDSEEKLIPGNGVYAVSVDTGDGTFHQGMMNIGVRPTIDGTRRVIEVNILDFEGDLYGKMLLISVMHYLRGEQKFSGLDALKAQLALDRQHTQEFFAG